MQNFTPLAERLPPDDVVHLLNDYYAFLTRVIIDEGGYLDKIMGDGFMALFNAPMTYIDHAQRAVRSAIVMRRLVIQSNLTRVQKLSVRIGIHTGEAVVANIGTSVLMNYTAIGDAVNTAKRIEELGEPDQILISAETCDLLTLSNLGIPEVELVPQGEWQLKGRRNPVTVYAVSDSTISRR